MPEVFAPFSSSDLECLAAFDANIAELQGSAFGRNLEKLGDPPRIRKIVRRPQGGGAGLLRVRHASPEARAAVFAVVRRLKKEHEYGSFHQACSILRGSTKRKGTDDAMELGNMIEAARRRIRDAGNAPATVGIKVTVGDGQHREYTTCEEISELAEYGQHFHQKEGLRQDWRDVPKPLLEPSVDAAMRATAEAALAIAPLVRAVLEEPALRLR